MDINKFIEPIGAFDVNIESSNSCGYNEGFGDGYGIIYEGYGCSYGYGTDDSNCCSVEDKNDGNGSGISQGCGSQAGIYDIYYGEWREPLVEEEDFEL